MVDLHFVVSLTFFASSSMVTSFVLPTLTTSPLASSQIASSNKPVTVSVTLRSKMTLSVFHHHKPLSVRQSTPAI